jgi:hypothetical protein
MDKKHLRLPKEGLVEPEETGERGLVGEDVEGHGLPTTAPPSIGTAGRPSHGGEIAMPADDEDDVEGHRRR